ncbi:MAG: AraC family transcriptional regulator [Candidatus Limivivens sp.]|nr:AraC family transcriptional regulator [Candidatus Limivivens sp.]
MLISSHEIIPSIPQLPVYFKIYEDSISLVPSHWHEHVEILMILEGTLHLNIHEQEYTLSEKDLFIVNSGDIHSTQISDFARVFLLQVPYSYLEQYISDFSAVRFREYFRFTDNQDIPFFQDMQQQLFALKELFLSRSDGYELAFSARLHDFLYTLYLHFSVRAPLSSAEQKNAVRLREILSFIEQHYKEPVTLGMAAKAAALNPEYFCRLFKKYTGATFLEYVSQVRLTHIYQELLSTEDTVTDILARNGFTNYKVFCRMFRETYGGTPTEVRRVQKQGAATASYNPGATSRSSSQRPG